MVSCYTVAVAMSLPPTTHADCVHNGLDNVNLSRPNLMLGLNYANGRICVYARGHGASSGITGNTTHNDGVSRWRQGMQGTGGSTERRTPWKVPFGISLEKLALSPWIRSKLAISEE